MPLMTDSMKLRLVFVDVATVLTCLGGLVHNAVRKIPISRPESSRSAGQLPAPECKLRVEPDFGPCQNPHVVPPLPKGTYTLLVLDFSARARRLPCSRNPSYGNPIVPAFMLSPVRASRRRPSIHDLPRP